MPDLNKENPRHDLLGAEQIRNLDELISYVRMLSRDVHAVKGALAANTAITMEVADRQREQAKAQLDLASTQERTNALLERIDVDKIGELVGVADNVKGGVKIAAWLGSAFKWCVGIAVACAAAWNLWDHK